MTSLLLIIDAQRPFYDTTLQIATYGAPVVDAAAAERHRRTLAATIGAARQQQIPILSVLIPEAGPLIQPLEQLLIDAPRYVKPTRETMNALEGTGVLRHEPDAIGYDVALADLLRRFKVTCVGLAGLYTSACVRYTALALKEDYELVTAEALLLDKEQRTRMPRQDRLLYSGLGALRENPIEVVRDLATR